MDTRDTLRARPLKAAAAAAVGILALICAESAECGGSNVTVNLGPAEEGGPDVLMDFVRVQSGEFMMGSADFAYDATPVHTVRVSRTFYLAKHETTVAQWGAFARAMAYTTTAERVGDSWGYYTNASGGKFVGHCPINWKKLNFPQGPNYPVVCISRDEAKDFCAWLTAKISTTVRLPTEAEWEYAARGTNNRAWPWGAWNGDSDLTRFNHHDVSAMTAGVPGTDQWSPLGDDGYAFIAPAGSYSNSISWCGAFEMSGNVREWVEDLYHSGYYSVSPTVDPTNTTMGTTYVRRGGGWRDAFYFSHPSRRDEHPSGDHNDELGFRTVLEAGEDPSNVVVSVPAVSVPEGGTTNFQVRLSGRPAADIIVTTVRSGGDTNLSVSGGSSLTFTPVNWNTNQAVTLSAAQDADAANGTASFVCSATGYWSTVVTAAEADDDPVCLSVSTSSVVVPEGGTTNFQVRLSIQPGSNITVTAARTGGDTDVSVTGGSSLTFTPANWNTNQAVTLSAAPDPDEINGTAVITCSAPGVSNVSVTAVEADSVCAITNPADWAVVKAGTNLTIAAAASFTSGTVSKVEFYDYDAKIGEDASPPYTCSWNNVQVGNHALTARAFETGGTVRVSDIVHVSATVDGQQTAYSMHIDLPGYIKPEVLTNFPVLIVLGAQRPGFDYNQFLSTNGWDLRFTASDGITELPYEIETWNPSGSSYIWVRVPALTPGAWMTASWGDDGDMDREAYTTNGAVWANGFAGVWHMGQAGAQDSTSNRINGTASGNTLAAGMISDGGYFNGAAFIDLGNPPVLPAGTSARTLSTWSRTLSTADGYRWSAAYGNPATSQAMFLGQNGTTLYGGGYANDVTVAGYWDTTRWRYNALTYDGTTACLYGDGSMLASAAKGWNLVRSAAYIGKQVNGAEPWNGYIDEVRISSVRRSADWLWAEYAGIASNESFVAFGPVKAANGSNTFSLVASVPSVIVPEGATASFQVRLSAQPSGNITVTAARTGGDPDISVSGESSLIFTPVNWNTNQTVTLAAAQDGDEVNGIATVTCSAAGAPAACVTAQESDDDLPYVIAAGGTVTNYTLNGTKYRAHIFPTIGTTSLTVSAGGVVDVLVVAGGGGGGGWNGGGGGAGGLIYTSSFQVLTGSNYVVTVGAGGAGSASGGNGSTGQNSVFGILTAHGGGFGVASGTGGDGGCGGGGGPGNTTPGQSVAVSPETGYRGGSGGWADTSDWIPWAAGGGGGAGEHGVDGNGTSETGTDGGDGLQIGISGIETWYAGGGGGGNYQSAGGAGGLGGGGSGNGTSATPNTGGGGGGGRNYSAGGNGGSGIVIVRYVTESPAPAAPSALTATAVSTSRIDLAWADNATNETGFIVERSTNGNTWLQITLAGANATNYSSTGLQDNTLYYYRVAATNAPGRSAWCGASAATLTPYEQWRRDNFTAEELADPAISGDDADADKDGMPNEDEYLAGTGPNNALSRLAFTAAEADPTDSNQFIIRWQSATGRVYAIMGSSNMDTAFDLIIRQHIPATPPVNVHTDRTDDAYRKFYRITLEP